MEFGEKSKGDLMSRTKVELCGMQFENPLLPASGPIVEGLDNLLSLNDLPLGGLVTKTISINGAIVRKPCIAASRHMVYNTELWSEYALEEWIAFLPEICRRKTKPLGISVGYTQDDFMVSIPKLTAFADFFEVSTHYNKATLNELVKTIVQQTDKPVFIKMSPHVADEMAFVETVMSNGASGIVAFNSFGPGAIVDLKSRSVLLGNEDGNSWVSGPAIKPFALRRIARIREQFPEVPIIGCGGVETAEDVLEMILAGADLVQMLSGALMHGRSQYRKIVNDLIPVMDENHIDSIRELRQKPLGLVPSGKGKSPVIDENRCTKCGVCIRVCPFQAYGEGVNPAFDSSKCIRCGLCQSMCPVHAISEVLR